MSILGPPAAAGLTGILIVSPHNRVRLNNITAPGIYVEGPQHKILLQISNSKVGLLWNPNSGGDMTISDLTIDRLLHGNVAYSVNWQFLGTVLINGLLTKNFLPTDNFAFVVSTASGPYLISDSSLATFNDWSERGGTPPIRVCCSDIKFTNNAFGLNPTDFANCIGSFGGVGL